MSTLIGTIPVPDPFVASTPFPLKPDYPYTIVIEPGVIVHQFGPIDAKIEQRFTQGDGVTKYQFRKSVLSRAERAAFITWWTAGGGALAQFTFHRPNPDHTTTAVTCRFADAALTLEAALGCISAAGITLLEVPTDGGPSYTSAFTITRGPVPLGTGIGNALLAQVQTLIPLVTISPIAWQTSIWGAAPFLVSAATAGDTSVVIGGLPTVTTLVSGLSVFRLNDVTYSVSADATAVAGVATVTLASPLVADAVAFAAILPVYPPVTISDRLVTVDGIVYQPRLLDWDGIQQTTGGGADQAGFILGNADRVFSKLANTVDLKRADVQFTLFHVETGYVIQVWRGCLTKYRVTAKPEFAIQCADGIYELTLPYPPRRVSRTCLKPFNVAEAGCPWATEGRVTTLPALGTAWGANGLGGLGIPGLAVFGVQHGDAGLIGLLALGLVPGVLGWLFGVDRSGIHSGATAVNITGLVVGGTIKVGDKFLCGGTQYTILNATTADSHGNCTVAISPGFVADAPDQTPISVQPAAYFGIPSPTSCDKGFDTPNGCQCHGMEPFFGGIVAAAQSVLVLDNSTGIMGFRRDTINSTSITSDTVYDQVVPEIYINWNINASNPIDATLGFPVNAKIIEGRDEGDFYVALGVVGEGPIQFPSVSAQSCQYFLDGQTPHGWPKNLIKAPTSNPSWPWGVYGLRRGGGHDPAINADPDGASDQFSLGQGGSGPQSYGTVKAGGTAFVEIRRADSPGLQLSTADGHSMQVPIRYGLPGYTWTAPGSRTLTPAINNPVWITLNAFLKGRGVWHAPAAIQEQYFDMVSIVAAASLCDLATPALVGTGTAPQFKFTGQIQEEKPLRGWMQELLNNCLGVFTFTFGKLAIFLRVNSSAVEAFTAGNVIFNSLQLDPIESAFNFLTINFADEEFGFAGNSVTIYNEDHAIITGGASGRPQYIKGTLNLAGVTTKDQAGRLASIRLCEEVGGTDAAQFAAARSVTYQTTALALNVMPGMVCSVTLPDCPDYPHQESAGFAWDSGISYFAGDGAQEGGLTYSSLQGGNIGNDPATDVAGAGVWWKLNPVTPPTPTYIEFRVKSWKLNKDFSVTVQGQTTNWDTYNVAVGPKPADVGVLSPPSIGQNPPAGWSFRAATKQDGTFEVDHFTCQYFGSAVVAANLDVYFCDEATQTEMFSPSGFLSTDLAIDYGTYGTLPVVGEWLACEGEVMGVVSVTPSDPFHGVVEVTRGEAGTVARDHVSVTGNFISHNADWLAEWTVGTGLDIHPGDGLVVTDGAGEEASVAEYNAATGLLRMIRPLATAVDGGVFVTVPTMRRIQKAQATVNFPERFFASAANVDFAELVQLPAAGVVSITGVLRNNQGLFSAPVTVQAVSETIMLPTADRPASPFAMRTNGQATLVFPLSNVPTGLSVSVFNGVPAPDNQPFESAHAEIGNAAGSTGSGPITSPGVSADPVLSAPVSAGSITITHTASGWEQVSLAIAGFTSTWNLAGDNIVPANSLATIATAMARWFQADAIGAYYSFTAVGAVVEITDTSGRGGLMSVILSPLNGAAEVGLLELTSVPLAAPLGVQLGRRYAFAYSGGGFRSDLSRATGSTGPTTSFSSAALQGLPLSADPRVTALEIYASADGQSVAGAVWRLVASLAITAVQYDDTMTETTLAAAAPFPGPTQPTGTGGAILFTITRDGAPWVQLRIPPGSANSNVVAGLALYSLKAGAVVNVDIDNQSGLTPSIRGAAE